MDILFSILAVIIIIMLWIMIYDSSRFVITKEKIINSKIKKNCRFVVISDLHNKQFGLNNIKLIEAIKSQEPDFIIVAGDIPIATPGKKLDIATSYIDEISKICPVYYGMGNHEHRMKIYPEVYGDMWKDYLKVLEKNNINLLTNEKAYLEEFGIYIWGSEIDRCYYKRLQKVEMDASYLGDLLGECDQEFYNILIAHNPDYFENYAAWGADLSLAGHVHGGMVRIPFINKGIVSPAIKLFPKYDKGVFKIGKSMMILSAGLGMHTIPIRLFNPGEIITIDLINN